MGEEPKKIDAISERVYIQWVEILYKVKSEYEYAIVYKVWNCRGER